MFGPPRPGSRASSGSVFRGGSSCARGVPELPTSPSSGVDAGPGRGSLGQLTPADLASLPSVLRRTSGRRLAHQGVAAVRRPAVRPASRLKPNSDAKHENPSHFEIWATKNPRFGGLFLMELAGLEPATSWVRSRPSRVSNQADLQQVRLHRQAHSVTSCRWITRAFLAIWSQVRRSVTGLPPPLPKFGR